MARRGMTGQLNMFDLFNSVDAMEPGEVEMVSLVPNFEEDPHPVVVEEAPVMEEKTAVVEEEQEVEEEPAVEEEAVVVKPRENQDDVAMSRSYKINGEKIEIAYITRHRRRLRSTMLRERMVRQSKRIPSATAISEPYSLRS